MSDPTNLRMALYCRVSSDEQADRETIRAQVDFLQQYCRLYGLPVHDTYLDDGVKGAIPLPDRPDANRLLKDAAAGRFDCVLVYKLDRLARGLKVLLDAHAALQGYNVCIRSGTEPVDTTTPIGRFIFHLLGSFAELEKSTIVDRTTGGRDRQARDGKWTGGPVPFGFDLDDAGRLVPSERRIPELDMTESEVLVEIFRRIAGGSTTIEIVRWLNASGVPCVRRYGGKHSSSKETTRTIQTADEWGVSRVLQMVKRTVYYGEHTFKSSRGAIVRTVPALVTRELWQAANRQLIVNRAMSSKNSQHNYLLRGLITCADCGAHYSGVPVKNPRTGEVTLYYRCNNQLAAAHPDPDKRCRGKKIAAVWIEGNIWADIRAFVDDPGPHLEDARKQLRARLAATVNADERRQTLRKQIAEKDAEREQIMVLFRRKRISLTDVERQMAEIEQEAATLQREFEAIRVQEEIAQTYEAHLTDAATLLAQLRGRVEEVEREGNSEIRRQIIERLVAGVSIHTEGDGYRKSAVATIRYTFRSPSSATVSTSATTSADNCISLSREVVLTAAGQGLGGKLAVGL